MTEYACGVVSVCRGWVWGTLRQRIRLSAWNSFQDPPPEKADAQWPHGPHGRLQSSQLPCVCSFCPPSAASHRHPWPPDRCTTFLRSPLHRRKIHKKQTYLPCTRGRGSLATDTLLRPIHSSPVQPLYSHSHTASDYAEEHPPWPSPPRRGDRVSQLHVPRIAPLPPRGAIIPGASVRSLHGEV